ncbi:MAG: hypothetical protein NTV56_16725 [Alphaproteobacteria bacterium]|nr:hypothetical protein [Alphaproteobacteria bacterium]
MRSAVKVLTSLLAAAALVGHAEAQSPQGVVMVRDLSLERFPPDVNQFKQRGIP